jgi:hypothetical protein
VLARAPSNDFNSLMALSKPGGTTEFELVLDMHPPIGSSTEFPLSSHQSQR